MCCTLMRRGGPDPVVVQRCMPVLDATPHKDYAAMPAHDLLALPLETILLEHRRRLHELEASAVTAVQVREGHRVFRTAFRANPTPVSLFLSRSRALGRGQPPRRSCRGRCRTHSGCWLSLMAGTRSRALTRRPRMSPRSLSWSPRSPAWRRRPAGSRSRRARDALLSDFGSFFQVNIYATLKRRSRGMLLFKHNLQPSQGFPGCVLG
jgi:hypothetical protein